MYRSAQAKGAPDKDRVLMGLGIALADQDKLDEAETTFGQITSGNRGQIAQLWIAYLGEQ